MPSKKKKYNARFPAGRIKKIMQTDEEVGKVAQAVPVIISRTLELFVESLLTKSMQITQSRNAKTMTPSHMKQCILSESRFDFLKDLVKNIPDASTVEEENNTSETLDFSVSRVQTTPSVGTSKDEQSTSTRAPVIQYTPKASEPPPLNYSIQTVVRAENNISVELSTVPPLVGTSREDEEEVKSEREDAPQLIPLSHNFYSQNTGDGLLIDEDYDN